MPKRKDSQPKTKKLPAKQLQQEVLKLFQKDPKARLNPRQVAQKLSVENNKDSVQHAINQLVGQGKIINLGDFRYRLNQSEAPKQKSKLYEGYVDMTRTGAAYIVCDGLEEDVYVAASLMNTAMHGDRVLIKAWVPRGRRRFEGEVVKVLERATEHFLGEIRLFPKYAIVMPQKMMAMDVLVKLEDTKGAKDGDLVVVKIKDWIGGKTGTLDGEVTTVLGAAGSHDIEMKAILINNGFNLDFDENIIKESESLQTDITEAEIAKRRDLRGVTTFTIDPFNAKDFDDALSFQYQEDGSLEVGVHIADVSHYVKPGTALDKEAYKRSTSVYLVDRVLPMLPEKLSNELCSLRPHEDKLTFSAIFIFDKNDKITSRWFGKTIIHSDRRFTYEEVQEILDGKEGDFADELKILNKIAHKLRKERFKKGAINFETEEVQFRLDEEGVPTEVFVKERKDAHMLIEDFMLLANREVATFITEKGKDEEIPFVYRIHDEPNPDKVMELASFASELGFKMKIESPKDISKSYNSLAEAAETNPALRLLQPLAIRTMAKAEYSTNNIGHYGLAFDYYSHFTSPIRRYSDVLAHRILELNLPEDKAYRVDKEPLEERCKHISMQERKAMDAERESVKYKQVEYLAKHVGDEFIGFISGIIDRGFFVMLKDNYCEGMVGFETMPEPFEVADSRLRMTGAYSRRQFKMGDEVTVRIVRTDISKRQIEMVLVEAENGQTIIPESTEKKRKRRSPDKDTQKTENQSKRKPGRKKNV
ncbi:MAG: ribonuclease R [Saprospiraceae bacterium]